LINTSFPTFPASSSAVTSILPPPVKSNSKHSLKYEKNLPSEQELYPEISAPSTIIETYEVSTPL
jgi:hypothetical protein